MPATERVCDTGCRRWRKDWVTEQRSDTHCSQQAPGTALTSPAQNRADASSSPQASAGDASQLRKCRLAKTTPNARR